MKKKEQKEQKKYNRDSAPYMLLIGLFVVVLLLAVSYIYYQRLIKEATEALGEEAVMFERHYVLICDAKDSDVWNEIYQEMQLVANEKNAYVELKTADESNQYTIADLMDISIAEKVDGIILQNHQINGLEDKINAASLAGIPVVTVLSDAPSTSRVCFVGTSPYTVADLYADEIKKSVTSKYKKGSKILVDVILTESETEGEQYQEFSEINTRLTNELPDYNIKVVAVRTNADEDFSYAESIFDLYRGSDIPDYVVCFNSIITDAVYQTVIDYYASNVSNILGSYLSPATREGMKNDVIIGTLMPDARQIGLDTIEALEEYIATGHTNAYYGIDVSLLKKGDLTDED